MSVTHIRKIGHTRDAVEYEEQGSRHTGERRRHRREGTDRIAAMRCDEESLEAFVAVAEATAEKHGRKIETLSIVQSFHPDEFDRNKPEDVQQVCDLGYELARRQWPHSSILVITHTDSVGGAVHNHVKVINHDSSTGKALQRTRHHHVAREKDELMREHQLRVVEVGKDKSVSAVPWELKRGGSQYQDFDRQLGDRIFDILTEETTTSTEIFRQKLARHGIELVEKRHPIHAAADGSTPEHESVGWVYTMRGEINGKTRKRRRMASRISDEFTYKGAHEIFEINRQRATPAPEKEVDHERRQALSGRDDQGSGAGEVRGARSVDVSTGAVGVVDGPGHAVGEGVGIGVDVYVPRGRARASDAADAGAEQVGEDDRGSAGDDLEAVRRQLRERRLRLERDGRPAAADHRRDGRDRRRDEPAARKAQRVDLDASVEQSRRGFRRPAGEKDRGGLELDF